MVDIVFGDVIELLDSGEYTAVAHGCNCMGQMGSGIAPILNSYSGGNLLKTDRLTRLNDINKLGSVTCYKTPELSMFNLYTQFKPASSSDEVAVHWWSYVQAVLDMLEQLDEHGELDDANILLPPIGCGLAGGKLEDFVYYTDAALAQWDGSTDNFVLTITTNDAKMYYDLIELTKD